MLEAASFFFYLAGFEILRPVLVRSGVFWNVLCRFVVDIDVSRALSAPIFRTQEVQSVIVTSVAYVSSNNN